MQMINFKWSSDGLSAIVATVLLLLLRPLPAPPIVNFNLQTKLQLDPLAQLAPQWQKQHESRSLSSSGR